MLSASALSAASGGQLKLEDARRLVNEGDEDGDGEMTEKETARMLRLVYAQNWNRLQRAKSNQPMNVSTTGNRSLPSTIKPIRPMVVQNIRKTSHSKKGLINEVGPDLNITYMSAEFVTPDFHPDRA